MIGTRKRARLLILTSRHNRRIYTQDAQKGRSARPQRVKTGAYPLGYVEDLNDARTMHGKRRVSARRGRAGEKGDFFSILLECPLGNLIQFIEINRVQSALCRFSRLAALGKELDGTILSLLLALKQS